MKYFIYIIAFTALVSCAKQAVKLPILSAPAVEEVYNNSAIWIFYTTKNGDTLAQLNKNNSISTTNWLFNIDRRLTLKQLYNPFKTMLINRQKVSPHHVDGLKNYFSFSDTLAKHIKFLPFSLKNIAYQKVVEKDTTTKKILFYNNHFSLNDSNYNYKQLDSVLLQTVKSQTDSTSLSCYYQDGLTFEKYVSIKANLFQFPYKNSLNNTTDFYFH